MDVLTFSQVLFNTLASVVILLFGAVLVLFIYCIVKFAKWMRRVEENINKSSERIHSFFAVIKDSFIMPIISHIFEYKKKRKNNN